MSIFFSVNLFRCLNFDGLESFLHSVIYVQIIEKIQVVWKGGPREQFEHIEQRLRLSYRSLPDPSARDIFDKDL